MPQAIDRLRHPLFYRAKPLDLNPATLAGLFLPAL
jgi:hypothetical protein